MRTRRGSTVLLVLALLAITLGLSYALMRAQATTSQMQSNLNRRAAARAAAETGLQAALRRMHAADWDGVNSIASGQIQTGIWFEAVYATGDEALTEADADYAKWPYRVTITSTGHAADPMRPGVDSIHQARAVVQLVPRKLVAAPAAWNNVCNYTVYQWSTSESRIELPVQIRGPVYLQSRISLCDRYPSHTSAREGYLEDLESMREVGLRDDRPFQATVSLPYVLQISNPSFTLLQSALDTPTQNISWSPASPVTHPGSVTTYRLYSGGRSFDIPNLSAQHGAAIQNVAIGPDVKTNPLGVFRTSQSLSLGDQVTLRGVLIAAGSNPDVEVTGKNVLLEAVDLPPVQGASGTTRLPVVIGGDDFRVCSHGAAILTGGVVVSDDFEFQRGATDTSFAMQGRLSAAELNFDGRQPWELSSTTWGNMWTAFDAQRNTSNPSRVRYFPQWALQQQGIAHAPLLTIEPPAADVSLHWHDWTKPVFEKRAEDEGLCWDVVRWEGA